MSRVSGRISRVLEFRGGGELNESRALPLYQILGGDGTIAKGVKHTTSKQDVKLLTCMIKLRMMDEMLLDAQRQGRIPFYATCSGEEGSVVGAAAGLSFEDEVFSQYREHGVLLWRGFRYQDFMDQCFGTKDEPGKGRQMPVHYTSPELHFQTVSSTIATQIPNSVGAAYALKMTKARRIAATFFGEGGTSEGDFHAGLNFAASLQCPVLFVCRNNGWAISTPAHQQYRGDGLAARGVSYGILSAAVDGNDPLAVTHAVATARKRCLETQSPVFLELVTYRLGPHSSSDNSLLYRAKDEVTRAFEKEPIARLRKFLISSGLWSTEEEEELATAEKKKLLDAISKAERKEQAPPEDVVEQVHNRLSRTLERQRRELMGHLHSYKDKYT